MRPVPLRFTTAGSVDDGKSTLIGRLLYDSKALFDDQVDAIERASRRRSGPALDLALATDGLVAEREQGITIDVAYRYFATPHRKFVIGDSPGHEQYTRNMVTAASTSDAAVLLVDAAEGLKPQTRRHAWLARWAGVTHAVLAVNKMDLVGYDEGRFRALDREFRELAADLGFAGLASIPISALDGDMVVERGDAMPWYDGPTLLEWLERIDPITMAGSLPFRLPVQRIARLPAAGRIRRALQGTITSGSIAVGDEVLVAPARRTARIAAIAIPDGPVNRAFAGDAVTFELDRDLDIARGDMLAAVDAPPRISRELAANLVWFDDDPLATAATYLVKHGTRTVRAHFAEIERGIDIATLKPTAAPPEVAMNALVRARLRLHEPLAFDPFTPFRATGAFIVIDEATHRTVAAGTIDS